MLTAIATAVLATSVLASPNTEYAQNIESFAEAMEDSYVFPDIGARCAALLRSQLEAGAYDDLDAEALAKMVHEQLMEITNDGHFGVRYSEPQPGTDSDDGGGSGWMGPPNHGFSSVKTLQGNVGYLDFRFFAFSEGAKETTDAAMAFLRDSDAIIVDMRKNGGGHPESVQYICSYFFGDTPVLLNSLYDRTTDKTHEYWTLEELPEDRFSDIPMYVLTSSRTFSGAEEFTYNLKTRKRATIVGETTGGGAHPVRGIDAGDGFMISVPFAKAINPVTGTNWEGTGVTPDVACEADKALDLAHRMALDQLSENASGGRAEQLAWASDFLRSNSDPVDVGQDKLRQYAGSYGPRQVTLRDGALFYSRDGGDERRLNAISDDTFMIDGVEFCKLVFEADKAGRITRLVGNYDNGTSDVTVRD